MTESEQRAFDQMFMALRRITKYDSPDRLRRHSEKDWGLNYEEALECAYENIQCEARGGLQGVRRRKPKPAGVQP